MLGIGGLFKLLIWCNFIVCFGSRNFVIDLGFVLFFGFLELGFGFFVCIVEGNVIIVLKLESGL